MSKKTKTGESSKREHIKWTDEMDTVFIDAMLEQQVQGFRVDGTFTSATYKNMVAIIEEKLCINLTKDHLKNRIKTFKCNFSICHELFKNKSGIAWNSQTKMFEADVAVWDDLTKANSNMKKWKTTPVYNYDKLEDLFSKDRATGDFSTTYGECMKSSANENHIHIEDIDVIGESTPTEVPSPSIHGLMNANDSKSSRSTKRKCTSAAATTDDTKEELQEMVKCMKVLVDHIIDPHQVIEIENEQEKKKEHEKTMDLSNLYEELEKIGVPQHRLVRAYVMLGRDKDAGRLFFSAPPHARLSVLNELMED